MSSSETMETTSPMYVMTSRAVATPAGGGAGFRSCAHACGSHEWYIYTCSTVVYMHTKTKILCVVLTNRTAKCAVGRLH